VLFGVALGNVLRGVPLDANGEFRGTFSLLLNPFALLGGLLSVATLILHGACWAALKTDGDLRLRARLFARIGWVPAAALLVAMILVSFMVRPEFVRNFTAWPVLFALPVVAVAALVVNMFSVRSGNDARAFIASSVYIAAILGSVAAGLYPLLLPASAGSGFTGLDIYNAAAPPQSLRTALIVYLVGLAIVTVYLANVYRIWKGPTDGVYSHR
jgi:cytochrome d ubiquinol oxidase subunit II